MRVRFFVHKKIPKAQTLLRFSHAVCRSVPLLRKEGEICVIFSSDKKIAEINRKFLKKNRPTDVIAFRYDAFSSDAETPFGDIVVSVDTALSQAGMKGHSLAQECALLIEHGLLHLAGYKDGSPEDQKKMFARQRELFRKIAPRLAPPDFR